MFRLFILFYEKLRKELKRIMIKREKKWKEKKITKEKREKVSQLSDFQITGETQFNHELLTQ